ncbi:MAG: Gfo/Idh/MocA family oxidoreductase [Oscillospiraceae bacterium]|nr:Gfo/Idh/MocA family oxidoreductase [Oscillospiraceae bacterium]
MAFRICIIGCGGISGGYHGPSYVKYRLENPDTELAACCDIDSEKALGYSKRFGFARCYTDYVQMLRDEKPDAVCVTVDEDHTAGVGIAVLNMGFPMFIEKPPGKNSSETRMLIDAARKSGVINQVGYNRRYMPMLQKLKTMLDGHLAGHTDRPAGHTDNFTWVHPTGHTDKSAGVHPAGHIDRPAEHANHNDPLQYIRYDFYRVGRYDEDFSDTAVHGIDAVRYIAGADYKRVQFSYQPLPQYGANVQNIYMDCEMTSGLRAQLSFCPVSGVVLERATVHARDNTWMANSPIWAESYDQPGELLHIVGGKTAERISGAELCGGSDELYITNGFYNENKAFFDSVKTGRKSDCDLEQALNTSLVKDCISNKDSHFGQT